MAELERVKGAVEDPAVTTAPTYQPYVPGVPAPEPPHVTVDGEDVAPGSGRMVDALRSGAAVMVVDGRVVGPSPVDLSSVLDPRLVGHLDSTFRALGLEGALGPLFGRGQPVAASLPGPETVDRLVPAPRGVPLSMRVGATAAGPTELFVLYLLAISPIALWLLVPWALLVAVCLGITVVGLRCVQRYQRLVPLLRDGEVATVVAATETMGASSYTNWPVRVARGWTSRWTSYSGQSRRTTLRYRIDGVERELTVTGAPYDGGVVLAAPRRPDDAVCVSQLPFSARPGPDGQLQGGLTVMGWVSVLLTLGGLAAMVLVLAVLLLP